ncbi:MAG: outer membrane lipoprotein-sorting protein [Pseudomonadota bacterium]
MRYLTPCFLLMLMLVLPGASPANDPLARGEEIAREAERRDKGFVDSISSVEMILTDSSGGEARRYLTIKTFEREKAGDGHKSLVIFHEPLDVKGTTLLTHGEIFEADQQWLYLPALKRVKRVPSSNKAGPFMASEFSYEDMLPPEVERYTHRYLGEVRCGDMRCFKIERTPKDKDSGYDKQIAYLDAEEYRLQRVDYFDRKQTHFKTLFFKDYVQYQDRFWRAESMTMVNHRSGKTTYLIWGAFAFQNGFTDADFSRVAMRQ